MSVIVRITDPPEVTNPESKLAKYMPKPEKSYSVVFDQNRLLCHPSTSPAPIGEAVECAKDRGRRETYVTPCGGVIDETAAAIAARETAAQEEQAAQSVLAATLAATARRKEDKKLSTNPELEKLLQNVLSGATSRHNVMIVYRAGQYNSPTDEFFAQLANDLISALGTTAEHAMQIVADEIAKEKQMQRLMATADSDRSRAAAPTVPKPPPTRQSVSQVTPQRGSLFGDEPQTPNDPASHLAKFSPRLRAALLRSENSREKRAISPKRPGTARSTDASAYSRYSVLSSAFSGALDPPELPDDSLAPGSTSRSRPTTADHAPFHQRHSGSGGLGDTIGRRGTFQFSSGANHDDGGENEDADAEETQAAKQKANKLRRKSSVRLLESLQTTVDHGPTIVKNNGWTSCTVDDRPDDKALRVVDFTGTPNFLCLPGTPNFETLVQHLDIDFWMRTDAKAVDGKMCIFHIGEGHRHEVGMQASLSLNWYTDFGNSMRLYIRDTGNRVMEVVIPLEGPHLTNGEEYHHYRIHVKNLEEGTVSVFIDGIQLERLRFLQAEHPNTFNPWVHRIYMGGVVDEQDEILYPFRGSILDLRFSHAVKGHLACRWPLLVHTANDSIMDSLCSEGGALGLVETTKAVPVESVVTAHNVQIAYADIPRVSPLFDGESLAVNCGPLGPFGDFLHHWDIEIRFKTTNTSRCMSLLGTTDSQHKMIEFGIVLNAEPLLGAGGNSHHKGERYRYHEKHITVYIVDGAGRCLSAIVRGDRSHVMDGEWHTIHWKIVDTESNRMEVRIDGKNQDCMQVCREGPKAFTALRDFVVVGAHGIRSWKSRNVFEGSISKVLLNLRDEKFVDLMLDEGPGGVIAVDRSGRHNHGLYIDPGNMQKKTSADVPWELANDHRMGPNGELLAEDGVDHGSDDEVDVIMYKHNSVAFAMVHVEATEVHGSRGSMQETLRDVLHPKNPPIELDAKPLASSLNDGVSSVLQKSNVGALYTLPESCFESVESMLVLREQVTQHIADAERMRKNRPGHLLFILKIGDAHISLLGLTGPFLPADAIFDANMLRWKSSVSSFGRDNKRHNVLNSTIHAIDKVFLNCTANPNLVRRVANQEWASEKPSSRPTSPRGGSLARLSIIEQIRAGGLPHRAASLIYSLLVDAEFSSQVHNIWNLWATCREDDAANVVLFQQALHQLATPRASLMIQRNWRGRKARERVQHLEELRRIKKERVDQIQNQRSINPHVLPKKTLKAIVITMHDFANDKIPSITSPAANDVIANLEKQGYAISHYKNPTRAQLLHAVHQGIDDQAMNFVYISGYGGMLRLQPPPQTSFDVLGLCMEEENARVVLHQGFGVKLRKLRMDFIIKLNAIMAPPEPAQTTKKGRAAKAAQPTKKQLALQAQQARAAAEHFKNAADDLMKNEIEARIVDILRPYEAEVSLITTEFRRALINIQQFESVYRQDEDGNSRSMQGDDSFSSPMPSGRRRLTQQGQQLLIVPADCPRVEPHPSDVVHVDELVNSALQNNMAPVGFQCVVAVDLAPMIPGRAGAGVLCSSTSHTFAFPYKPDQRDVLSLQLRKALLGYPQQLPIRNLDALLLGAVECEDRTHEDGTITGGRDWRSFSQYICTRVAKRTAVDGRLVFEELSREVDYTADLVPTRRVIMDADQRDKQRREREHKRVGCNCIIAIDSQDVSSDMAGDLKSYISLMNIVDVQQLPRAIVTLIDENHMIDLVNLDVVENEVSRSVAPGVSVVTTLTTNGVDITVNSEEKSKVVATLNSIAQRSSLWKIPLKGHKKSSMAVKTEFLFAVRGTANMRKHKLLDKQRCEDPTGDSGGRLRFLECLVE